MKMRGSLGMQIKMFLICMRPQQWIKNLLVFAAPFTAGALTDIGALTPLFYLFLIFSAASSTNYVLNDWMDKDYDAQHSHKKHRPFASEKIGHKSLFLMLVFLVTIQIPLSFLIPLQALFWVVAYSYPSVILFILKRLLLSKCF